MEPYEIEVRERNKNKGYSPAGITMTRAEWDRRYLLELLDIERARHAALVVAARAVVESTDLDYALGVAQGEIGPNEYVSAATVIDALASALDGEKE